MVGCKNNNSLEYIGEMTPSDTPITLSVRTYYSGIAKDVFYDLVGEFNETVGKEYNIIVEPRSTGNVNELADSILASANQDIGCQPLPHIFMAYPDSAYKTDKMGLILDLDPYFTQEELDMYHPAFLDDGRFGINNTLKIIPVAKSSEIFYLNQTDFDLFCSEVDVDMNLFATWEGISQISEQYYNWTDAKTDTLNDGKAFFGIDAMANYMIIGAEQLGNPIFNITDKGAELTITRETAKTMWDNFYIPIVRGYYADIGNFRTDDAKTGDILAYTGSTAGASWFPTQIETGKNKSYPIEPMTFPLPVFQDGTPVAVHQGAGMVVTKSDDAHQNASILFLKWMNEPEQNSRFALQTGYIPVKSDLLNVESFHAVINDYEIEDIQPVVAMTVETTYDMLNSYQMHADKPFGRSYEARMLLEHSMIDFAHKDLAAINEATKLDDKENVLSQYITDENFDIWYNTFTQELSEIIAE